MIWRRVLRGEWSRVCVCQLRRPWQLKNHAAIRKASAPPALADMVSAQKVRSPITPDDAYCQVPAGIADDRITADRRRDGWPEDFGEISRGEKMTLRGTDPASYVTEYTLVYEDYQVPADIADNKTTDKTTLHPGILFFAINLEPRVE